MTQTHLLLHEEVRLMAEQAGQDQSSRYFHKAFTLPEGCVHLVISLTLDSSHPVQLPVCLFDPSGHVRLMKAGHRVTRETLTFDLTQTHACSGGIPGPLPAGNWKLVIYKRRMLCDVSAVLDITWEQGVSLPAEEPQPLTFARQTLDTRQKWYQGELHTHSNESTGRTTAAEVVEAARACGLDFLALTDHFTASHWHALQNVSHDRRPLLMQSVEVSGDRGHANLHGLTEWVNPLVDDNEELTDFLALNQRPSMNSLADAVHAQGGLMCVNHPLSGELGWRYHEFDLSKADLVEAWCLSERDATLAYPAFYDMLLTRGHRLTAVGSSDSHHPTNPGPWQLGRVRTYIYADDLSQKSLLAGLKAGHAYVSVEGCEMNLTATCGGQSVMMGDELMVHDHDEIIVAVELAKHPKGNLFLYLNGLLLESCYVEHAAPVTLTFRLPSSAWNTDGYLRVEFYEIEGELPYYGYSWRDWKSLRLMSNPIYIRKEK